MPSVDSTVELLHVFGDATRVRLLALLSDEELSVAELTSESPSCRSPECRPTSDACAKRGCCETARSARLRSTPSTTSPCPTRHVDFWELVRADLDDTLLESDRARRERLRASSAVPWPDFIAGQIERHYSPGRTWEATARGLIGFVQFGDLLDLGSGDGAIARSARAPRP